MAAGAWQREEGAACGWSAAEAWQREEGAACGWSAEAEVATCEAGEGASRPAEAACEVGEGA